VSALPEDDEAGAVERHLEVARSARYWTLGDPEREHEEVWVVLHGYGQLARRFLRRLAPIAVPSRLIVAPEALSRFYIGSGEGRHRQDALVGATWMTREDREAEIRDYVAYLDRLADVVARGAPRVTVLGFSQGVATAWRWVTYGSVPGLSRLVAWAGELPPDIDLARAARALADVEVVWVHGDGDPVVPAKIGEVAAERLEQVGVPLRSLRHPGGHDIHEETLRAVAG
jgi:predicted esterase